MSSESTITIEETTEPIAPNKSSSSPSSKNAHNTSNNNNKPIRSMSPNSPTKSKVNMSTEERLKDIEAQIIAVRKAKMELKPVASHKKSPPKKKWRPPKKGKLYHTKLEYVFGEILSSPYMTPPLDNYPKTTYTLPEELRALKVCIYICICIFVIF